MNRVLAALIVWCLVASCREKTASKGTPAPGTEADEVALRGFALWEKPKKDRDEAAAQLAFQDACDRGSQLGCAGLGAIYLSGSKNPAKGIELVQHACDAKVLRACASLSVAYESGIGVDKDGAKAAAIAKNACDAGEHRACVLYGRPLLFGDFGLNKDPTRSRDLGIKACDAKIGSGCTLAGLAFSNGLGDAVAASKWLQKGCDLGDGQGCAAAATQFFRGGLPGDAQGVTVSPGRGVELAMRACDLDAPVGCTLLAKAFANGEGVARDLERARQLARKACDESDALGCSVAAQIARADGNENEAISFLQRSCSLGNSVACRAVAPR
jgi:uncharacterized protein